MTDFDPIAAFDAYEYPTEGRADIVRGQIERFLERIAELEAEVKRVKQIALEDRSECACPKITIVPGTTEPAASARVNVEEIAAELDDRYRSAEEHCARLERAGNLPGPRTFVGATDQPTPIEGRTGNDLVAAGFDRTEVACTDFNCLHFNQCWSRTDSSDAGVPLLTDSTIAEYVIGHYGPCDADEGRLARAFERGMETARDYYEKHLRGKA